MKSILSAIVTILIPVFGFSQVIPNDIEEYIELKSGARMEVEITNEDKEYIYFKTPKSDEERKIPKSSVENYQKAEIWNLPFNLNDEGKVEYSEVVEIDGASKNELYNRARLWFANHFNNSEEVLELDDKEAGRLIGTGYFTIFGGGLAASENKVWETFTIEVKDGKFRYKLNNIQIEIPPNQYSKRIKSPIESFNYYINPNEIRDFKRIRKAERTQILTTFQSSISSLREAMKVASNDDW